MKRYVIELTDQYGITESKIVTPKELAEIEKYNPQLSITVRYTLIGNFSDEN